MGGIRRSLGYREVQVERVILDRIEAIGRIPSLREICAATGISTKGNASRTRKSLERKGLVPLRDNPPGHIFLIVSNEKARTA